jgi:hypothetical protein
MHSKSSPCQAAAAAEPCRSRGHRLLPLLQDAVRSRGAFSSLQGQAFDATIRLGEVPRALQLSRDASGTSATLTSRLSGLRQNFSANSPAQLRSDVTKFVQGGANAYSRFQEAVDRNSVFGVMDGNPHSATAMLGEDAFFRWGYDRSTEWLPPDAKKNAFDVRFNGGGGAISAKGFDGYYYTGAFGFDWQFPGPIGIALSIPFEERELGDTATYLGGAQLGFPITLIPLYGKNEGVGWRVTPFASAVGVAYSRDLLAGGFFAGGGVVSSLRARFGRFQVTLADQVTYDSGYPLTIGEIKYKTDVEQWFLKNGVEVTYRCTDTILLDGGVAFSNFIKKAAVPDFWTPTAGVNFEFARGSGIHIGYRGNFGSKYHDNGGAVDVYFRL